MPKQFHAKYYEAIIQLRPNDLEVSRFLENQIRKNEIQVAKILKLKTGVDYYVSSNKFARKVGKKMKQSFKGVLKESKKLFSRGKMSSKELYRVTICFRLDPPEED